MVPFYRMIGILLPQWVCFNEHCDLFCIMRLIKFLVDL